MFSFGNKDDRLDSPIDTMDEETQPILSNEKSYPAVQPDADVLPPQQQVQFILGELQKGNLGERSDSESGIPCVFTEMEELKVENDGETVWRETARWIKFEECVEAGGDRWSKPHVATLSLRSMLELRSNILNGVVLLDVKATEISQIVEMVLNQMFEQGHLSSDEKLKEKLRIMLLSRHEHQYEKKNMSGPIKSVSDFVSRNFDSRSKKQGPSPASPSNDTVPLKKSMTNASSFGGFDAERPGSFIDSEKKIKVPYFMKKIPAGAEASNVLVGEVDFVEQRIVAFVRLADAVIFERLTEVPIPTRFIFFSLGPPGKYRQCKQVGRSIATLMTDEVFCEVAYKAKARQDLLAGIDEFLDHVTILPPGAWDASIRIKPPKELPGNQKKRLEPKANGTAPGAEGEKTPEQQVVGPELQRTGRLFGGMIQDIKRKVRWYKSDFTDCLSLQCVASFFFIYFAVLTPIVTFGGLLGDATHSYLGTMESIVGGAMSGSVYHLFSGQPLTIIGSTGPILVYEKIMFEICHLLGLEYISFRFWVGIWTGFMCILLVAFDASSLISYVTRYTEESFSALISFIFIYQAFKKLFHEADKLKIWYDWDQNEVTHYGCHCIPPNLSNYNVSSNATYESMLVAAEDQAEASHEVHYEGLLFKSSADSYFCARRDHVTNITDMGAISWHNLTMKECLSNMCGSLDGSSCPYTPDAMLMSVVLFFGTFYLSTALKGMKTSRYFPTKVRSIISDFAVTIAIVVMVVVDLAMGLETEKLAVPHTFRPTRHGRTWLVHPFGNNPWWSAVLAVVPAFLATILVFMDQQITVVIVSRKENKLKKGGGYHLDLFIVAVMLIICSIMGLPWFVAATVLSITHVNSLKMETETSAPGETPKFLGVREQRVTGLMVFLMIGVSIFLTPILSHIPMPVLYGVFLYMGVSSLKGVQFVDRIKLFLMPPKHQPDFIYLRHVRLSKVHLFTFIQALGLAALWVIKLTSPISIVFPMMVAALVGVRKLFDFGLFTQQELMWLDDIMPESTKKKKEDAKKKKEEEATLKLKASMVESDSANILLQDRNVIEIPASDFKSKQDDPSDINISKEMAQTAIWKTIAANDLGGGDLRNRSKKVSSSTAKLNNSDSGNGAYTTSRETPSSPPPSYPEVSETKNFDESGI